MSLESPEWSLLGMLAVFVAIAAVTPLWMSRPSQIGRFARTVGLPLGGDVELERTIGARLRIRARWGALGMVVAAVVGVLLVLSGALTAQHEWGATAAPISGLALAGIVLTGRGIGTAISILPAPPEVQRHGARIARLPRPTVADYVAPIERIGARIFVGFGGLVAVAVVFLPAPAESRLLIGATAVTAIAALAGAEWVSSALVSRPQPAVSEQLLRWDDALRAQTLRDLVSVPLMAGGIVVVAAIFAFPDWPAFAGTVGHVIGSIVAYAVLIALIGVAVVSIAMEPARYYLKRLWPAQYAETQTPAYGSPAATPSAPSAEGA
ncbi:hypothetical protein [Agromyces sp. CCNWLW203]|uniref:hypothetical protein n=1 Tax=Agromyces sp. CCNWLW203 TaxID=3112842 RepID=UPI002F9659D6